MFLLINKQTCIAPKTRVALVQPFQSLGEPDPAAFVLGFPPILLQGSDVMGSVAHFFPSWRKKLKEPQQVTDHTRPLPEAAQAGTIARGERLCHGDGDDS